MAALAAVSAAIAMTLSLSGCREIETFENDVYGNFDALWKAIDEHYCFLDEKGLDWGGVRQTYRSQLKPDMKDAELFEICGKMINELKDGHVNLTSPFNTTYYRKWWTEYPQDFDLRCLEQYYLDFEWDTNSGIIYKNLGEYSETDSGKTTANEPETNGAGNDDAAAEASETSGNGVGYIRYTSFSSTISESALDYAFLALKDCKALIIDIRDNGGGTLTNVETLVRRFIDEEITAGYIQHKTGPGHNEFSKPFEFRYSPNKDHIRWLRPVLLLVNRSCFSAANNFAGIMKTLPNVALVGSRTGGGGGLPFSADLPNGWVIRFSACPILDPNGKSVESGVDPTPHFEMNCSPEDLAKGKDAILDLALEVCKKLPGLHDPAPAEGSRPAIFKNGIAND